MKFRHIFNGTIVECELERYNLRQYVASMKGVPVDEVPETLVLYDKERNVVTVDSNASKMYARFAAAHECVCCCSKYASLVQHADSTTRCGLIDQILIESMLSDSEKEEYREARIEMFDALIKYQLTPELNSTFEASRKMLRQMR